MPPLVLANLTLWVTPLWLIGLGVAIALAALLTLFGVVRLVRPVSGRTIARLVGEGVLAPISYVLLAFVAIVAVACPVVDSREIFESLGRLQAVDRYTVAVEVPPRTDDFPVELSFRAEELTRYRVESNQDIRLAGEPGGAFAAPAAVVLGGEPYEWALTSRRPRGFTGDIDTLYLTNEADAPAAVSLGFVTDVRVPEVHDLKVVVASVLAIFLLYLLTHAAAPSISNIAIATAKEACGQPLFLLLLSIGGVALVTYIVLPFYTLGEDVKMLTDSGLSTIMVLSIGFAVWTASVSVAEEIEGKTALTLLSKPISRRHFIVGKFLGIVWSTVVMFVVLGAVLIATVSYKVVYDARETSNPTPTWQECYRKAAQVAPGLALCFMQTATLAAVSVAISTRLPMLPNLVICGSIYVLGNLTPLIAQSSEANNEFVQFFAQLFALVLPVLEHFNIQPAVAAGKTVPAEYLLWAALYCVVYCSFAMLLALLLFEDRDLA